VKAPIILEGKPFDWESTNAHGPAVNAAGEVNWAAAAWGDPGVMKCPACGVYLWNEGTRVRCPDCSAEFDTGNRKAGRDGH
jgi:hypothetical protein